MSSCINDRIPDLCDQLILKPGQIKYLVLDTRTRVAEHFSLCLSNEEHAQCNLLKNPIDQRAIQVMRGAWKLGASALSGIPVHELVVERSRYNRPRISSHDQSFQVEPFDPSWDLNVSRSNHLIALVLSKSGPCGIDLEYVDQSILTDYLFEFLKLDRDEQALCREQPVRFYQRWVRIEAVLKADGRGFNQIEQTGFPTQNLLESYSDPSSSLSKVSMHELWAYESRNWSVFPIMSPSGFVGALGRLNDGTSDQMDPEMIDLIV